MVSKQASAWRIDALLLFALLAAGLKYTFGMERVLDVALYDESSYLHSGLVLLRDGPPRAPFAPLYAVWYAVLSFLQPDAVALYYLNYRLTTVLPPLLLYVLLRVRRVPVVPSFIVAAYLLITQAVFVTWPRVTHFALLIVLASLIVATLIRRRSSAVLVVAIGSLLAAYVRPEFFLAFLLLLASVLGLVVVEYRQEVSPRVWFPLAGVVALAAGLLSAFGSPAFGRAGGERHFYAFAQHFALNWARWNHVDSEGPYNPGTNFREIAAKFFGSADSVGTAFTNNPGMFCKHIATNIGMCVARFPGLFMHHENIYLPVGKPWENLEARLTLVGLVVLLVWTRKKWLPDLRRNWRTHRRLFVCAALLCVPSFISIVEIYPHDHYMLLPGTLLIAGAAVLLLARPTGTPPPTSIETLGLALLILAIVPAISHQPAIPTPIVATIRSLQSLKLTQPVDLLDAEGGYDIYQTANYQRVAESDKHEPFDHFLSERHINLVVLTKKLATDSHFAGDPTWETFLQHPQDAGFETLPVLGTDTKILVVGGLLGATAH